MDNNSFAIQAAKKARLKDLRERKKRKEQDVAKSKRDIAIPQESQQLEKPPEEDTRRRLPTANHSDQRRLPIMLGASTHQKQRRSSPVTNSANAHDKSSTDVTDNKTGGLNRTLPTSTRRESLSPEDDDEEFKR